MPATKSSVTVGDQLVALVRQELVKPLEIIVTDQRSRLWPSPGRCASKRI